MDKDMKMLAKQPSIPAPTEDEEQIALFQWADWLSGRYPELKLLLHIPNGGKRGKAEAGRFKAMGVKPGVPDILLPISRGKSHGLWIELKRVHKGRISSSQREWLHALRLQGYAAYVCNGWEHASKTIINYIEEQEQNNDEQEQSI